MEMVILGGALRWSLAVGRACWPSAKWNIAVQIFGINQSICSTGNENVVALISRSQDSSISVFHSDEELFVPVKSHLTD
ncbi:hypothetical protein T08_14657 [Trichinella sp. T8]|nr:hypothetical protein T08_14657 [Trichinella sp. T8]